MVGLRENEAGLSYNRSFHDVIHILGAARTREKMRQVSAKIILLQYFQTLNVVGIREKLKQVSAEIILLESSL